MGFGFCSHLWQMMLCAGIAGVASGNVGVMRTAMAEMVPQEALQAKAFAILPAAAAAGYILGPSVGGFLSQASKGFTAGTMLYRYPFALPAVVTVSISLVAFVLTSLLFLETNVVSHGRGYMPLTASPLQLDDEVPMHPLPDSSISKLAIVQRCAVESSGIPPAETGFGGEEDSDSQPKQSGERGKSLQSMKRAFVQPFKHLGNANVWLFTLLTLSSSGYDNLLPVFLHYDDRVSGEETFHPSMGLGKGRFSLYS
ncbi:hypothetical protein LTR97_007237 [Elasticomyces elasticus]|uniref:Major facilitator superfamily (MFS) profile domain-containing protein n=1 Tax=Elasticomyces elasticus TaxID=574655 RepID=A0AAN7W619_9PEZI|nr:hypothetical protein LTR97_007237 [Elasticomyces elasticus]